MHEYEGLSPKQREVKGPNPNSERLSPVELYEREVLPRLSLETVYSGVAFTKRTGRYWRGPCPLHGGKDSNFSVDTRSLRWTCFSHCGQGSALAFLNGGTEPRSREFVEVVKRVATLAGVNSSVLDHRELTPGEEARVQARARQALLFETFLQTSREFLHSESGFAARNYLQGRGFDEPWLAELDLGFYATPEAVKAALARNRCSITLALSLRAGVYFKWAGPEGQEWQS